MFMVIDSLKSSMRRVFSDMPWLHIVRLQCQNNCVLYIGLFDKAINLLLLYVRRYRKV